MKLSRAESPRTSNRGLFPWVSLAWSELASPSTSSRPSTVVGGGSKSKRSPTFHSSRFSNRASPLTGPSSSAPSQGRHSCPSPAVPLAALRNHTRLRLSLSPAPLYGTASVGVAPTHSPWHAHEVALRLVPLSPLPRGRTNRFLASVPLLVAQLHPTHLTSPCIAACQPPTHLLHLPAVSPSRCVKAAQGPCASHHSLMRLLQENQALGFMAKSPRLTPPVRFPWGCHLHSSLSG